MHEVKSIEDLLNQIERNEILLPEFQRGYVWNRDQVRGLMQSLYRKHPTGHLLVWRTYKPSKVRGDGPSSNGHSLLLLDGQQRLTTLYVLVEGKAPPFYEGESLFFDLYFNVQTEEFRFWQKSHMENNPAWFSVHDLLSEELNNLLDRLGELPDGLRDIIQNNLSRLARLDQIRGYNYTVDQVTGDNYTVDEVVDIFNRVNSRGTPLTKVDLSLAHICSIWPEARAEMRTFNAEMSKHGFGGDFNFLVRCLAGIATGSVTLEGPFLRAPAEQLQVAWLETQVAFEYLVNVLKHEAFIDDLNDLPTSNVLVPMTVYLARQGGSFPSDAIKGRFIRWMYLAGLWARYSGATETKLQQDTALVSNSDPDPTPELEAAILRERGRLTLEASDLAGAGINSAVGRFSYVLARARGARDWFTGIRLYDDAVGKRNGLESHHIFPKKVLYQAGLHSRSDSRSINEVANRAFLTQRANRKLAAQPPAECFVDIERNQPGTLRAQCVPMDRELWEADRFLNFLAARRQLLAQAMNEFIASWVPKGEEDETDESAVRRRMEVGENETLEFKLTLRWDRRDERVNKELEKVVVKTLAGFLNGHGGTLLIGVDDTGAAVGISVDYETLRKNDRDGFELHLQQLVARDLGEAASSYLTITFHEIDGHDVCQVTVEPSDHPIYVDDRNTAVFFLRTGNATRPLPVNEAVKYVQHRWGKAA